MACMPPELGSQTDINENIELFQDLEDCEPCPLLLNFASSNYSNQDWLKKALRLAEKAFSEGEVPVGAIVVKDNRIIGQGYNQRERLNDPTAHAEIIAITAAAGTLGDCRLNGCSLYVTK